MLNYSVAELRYIMKNLFYFIISICTLYACSSDSDFNPEDENPTSSDFYELKAIPDKKVIFKAYPANMKRCYCRPFKSRSHKSSHNRFGKIGKQR